LTDALAWSVCLSVGHIRKSCNKGWIDPDAN